MSLPRLDHAPQIHDTVFLAPGCAVIGEVAIGEFSSVWFGAVVRGDVHFIRIGARTNLQDRVVVHTTREKHPTVLGDDITVGHGAVLHGCSVGNRVLVGMSATLMDGVEIGEDCIVAAGALVAPGTKVPPGQLLLGSPAKVKRPLTGDEIAAIAQSAKNYCEYVQAYRARGFNPVQSGGPLVWPSPWNPRR
jgi:carbonic anhydrase/acetyltransferase-like protein (isoleucine patch superfamily)